MWLNLTCMMSIAGREGFQLLSVSVTDKQGDGTMGRRSLSPYDCLVVKPTAGASDDKRGVSIIWRKGHFRNWFKESGKGDSGGYVKKWKELVHFPQMGPSKSLILFNFWCIQSPVIYLHTYPPHIPIQPSVATLLRVCALRVDAVFAGGNEITVHFIILSRQI